MCPTIVLLVFAVLVGCGDDPPAGAAGDRDEPPEWRADVLLRIGSLDDPEQALVAIGDVKVGPDGRLYVLQPADAQIRVFGVLGDLELRIGRRGDGPGDFRSISGMGFRGDSLYVADRGLHRMSFFAGDGSFIGSEAWGSERIEAGTFLTGIVTGSAVFITSAPQVLLPDGSGLLNPEIRITLSPVNALEPGPRRMATPGMRLRIRPGSSSLVSTLSSPTSA